MKNPNLIQWAKVAIAGISQLDLQPPRIFHTVMMKPLVALLAIVTASHALSTFDTITTKSGRTFEAVSITKQEPDGLRITHAEGTAKILFADLPDEILVFFKYDPAAAEAHQKKVLNERLAAEKEKKVQTFLKEKGMEIEGTVLQVHQQGLLITDAITAMIKFPDGTERPASPAAMEEASKLKNKPPLREVNLAPGDLSLIFLEQNPAGIVDNQKVNALVWPIGTYRYVNSVGSARTIPRYTSSSSLAREVYSSQF